MGAVNGLAGMVRHNHAAGVLWLEQRRKRRELGMIVMPHRVTFRRPFAVVLLCTLATASRRPVCVACTIRAHDRTGRPLISEACVPYRRTCACVLLVCVRATGRERSVRTDARRRAAAVPALV